MAAEEQSASLTNVVFMGEHRQPVCTHATSAALLVRQSASRHAGMGEPLQNLEAVLVASQVICHPLGLHFGAPKASRARQVLAARQVSDAPVQSRRHRYCCR